LKSQSISFLKVYLPIQWRISYPSSKWALPAWTIKSTTCWYGVKCSFEPLSAGSTQSKAGFGT
jgi:hypothetical protein